MKKRLIKFKERFSEKRWMAFLSKRAGHAGKNAIYSGLLLYFAYKKNETPSWAKNIILGALGYLITPIDMLPDLTPFLGYTDDIGVLSFGLVTIASYIDTDIRLKSKDQLKKWFPNWDTSDLDEVDMIL